MIGGLFYFQVAYPLVDRSESILFKVDRGLTLKQVAYQLAKSNLIKGSSSFRLLAYIQNKQNQIKAGEFRLSASMTPIEILHRLTSGLSILYSITIPEGYRITEIADLLRRVKLVDKERFFQSTRDVSLISYLGIPMKSLEGYLFPDTYYFSKNTSEQKIVKSMLDTFIQQVSKPEYTQRAKEIGFSFHEVIILASLIEKETGDKKERSLISAVFHNRLKKNMRLQCDPSVIYVIKDFDGNLRKKDLSIDSLYNTYRYSGLPPGPIANPGLDSIKAALYPATVNYIYFVSKRDGSHAFSSTLEEHNQAVRKYQLRKRKISLKTSNQKNR